MKIEKMTNKPTVWEYLNSDYYHTYELYLKEKVRNYYFSGYNFRKWITFEKRGDMYDQYTCFTDLVKTLKVHSIEIDKPIIRSKNPREVKKFTLIDEHDNMYFVHIYSLILDHLVGSYDEAVQYFTEKSFVSPREYHFDKIELTDNITSRYDTPF
ncbi:hypothetical protein N8069_04935 [Flavobacteriaceae bacterium]|nr:hypothetical protein [Flavobacteriaceae bacterium]